MVTIGPVDRVVASTSSPVRRYDPGQGRLGVVAFSDVDAVRVLLQRRQTVGRTDSNSDSNTGGPLWFMASRGAEGAQVADAYERR